MARITPIPAHRIRVVVVELVILPGRVNPQFPVSDRDRRAMHASPRNARKTRNCLPRPLSLSLSLSLSLLSLSNWAYLKIGRFWSCSISWHHTGQVIE
ncbi:hypothetical protein CRG98_019400, partial [Punica granatum]